MDYKSKSSSTFDAIAAKYESSSFWQTHANWNDQIISTMANFPADSVLDIGCGNGAFLERIIAQTDVSMAGIDLSPLMVEVARKRLGLQADIRQGDAETLPWPDESFDMPTCIASFHHYPDPTKALSEMRRVLKPTGHLFLAEIHFPGWIRPFINAILPILKTGDFHMYSKDELFGLGQQSGLRPCGWHRLGENGFLCIFERDHAYKCMVA